VSWYLEVLKKYAVFSGRSRRAEYWYFVLFNLIVIIVLSLIDTLLGTFNVVQGVGLLSGIYTAWRCLYRAWLLPSGGSTT
jgi:uncharacterized membrane protein YhaH (DUF805 family)